MPSRSLLARKQLSAALRPAKEVKLQGVDEQLRLLLQSSRGLIDKRAHYQIPALNADSCPLESFDALRVYPRCIPSMIQAVHVAKKHCEPVDICHKRTLAQEIYKRRMHNWRTRYLKSRQSDRIVRGLEKQLIYHKPLFDIAEGLEYSPDPFFNANYDYYYTGGNLCALSEGSGYVVHVDAENLNVGRVSVLPIDDSSIVSLQRVDEQAFAPNGEIFEVRPLRNAHDSFHCFAIRQSNSITLHALEPERDRLTPLTQFKTGQTPLISFAQSASDFNILLVSSMKQQVHWYDLNASTPKLQRLYKFKTNKNADSIGWNVLKSWRAHTFLYANEKKLCCMDLRTTPAEWLETSVGLPENSYELGCETISSLACSGFPDLLYVGTTHNLHCLDVRYMKRHLEADGAVCRWTHQLQYAPGFMTTFRKSNSEFIALASAMAGDLCICELTAYNETRPDTESMYMPHCLPYQPLTLLEAYESARLAGKWLSPDADLRRRIHSCTTGLTVCSLDTPSSQSTSERQHVLLFSNSLGDIFAQTFDECHTETYMPRSNACSDEMVAHYADKICRVTQPPLNYTDVVNMRAMKKVFRCNALDSVASEEKYDKIFNNAITASKCFGRWQRSMSTLYKYKDALAQDLLAIWDVDYKEKKEVKVEHLDNKLCAQPSSKTIVSNWLNSTEMVVPMATVPLKNLDDSHFALFDANDFAAQHQSTQIIYETVSRMESTAVELQQIADITVMTFNADKKIHKKSKYIKGF